MACTLEIGCGPCLGNGPIAVDEHMIVNTVVFVDTLR